jgi:hypothetical protein
MSLIRAFIILLLFTGTAQAELGEQQLQNEITNFTASAKSDPRFNTSAQFRIDMMEEIITMMGRAYEMVSAPLFAKKDRDGLAQKSILMGLANSAHMHEKLECIEKNVGFKAFDAFTADLRNKHASLEAMCTKAKKKIETLNAVKTLNAVMIEHPIYKQDIECTVASLNSHDDVKIYTSQFDEAVGKRIEMFESLKNSSLGITSKQQKELDWLITKRNRGSQLEKNPAPAMEHFLEDTPCLTLLTADDESK